MFSVKSSTYNLRNQNSLQLYHSRTNYGLHFFRHIGVKLWNDLPHHVKSITDIYLFLKSFYIKILLVLNVDAVYAF